MLTNKDIEELQEMENRCVLLAEQIANGDNKNSGSLTAMIENLNFQTRKKLYKTVR